MFLKNRNISSKIKRSKVTDYTALNKVIAVVLCKEQQQFWLVAEIDKQTDKLHSKLFITVEPWHVIFNNVAF